MAYLLLRDVSTGRRLEFGTEEVRLGRDPSAEVVPAGEGSEVVSGRHARFVRLAGRWHVEDLGSSNGTFLDGQRLPANDPRPVVEDAEIRLGMAGPRYRVQAAAKQTVAETLAESPAVPAEGADTTMPMEAVADPAATPIPGVPETGERAAPELIIAFEDLRNRAPYHARGGRIRLGRGRECEIRPVTDGDTVVSRVHAEITLAPGPPARAVLRDAQSRNGTIVNGGRLTGAHELSVGDRVELGRGGPDLKVEHLTLPGPPETAPAPVAEPASVAGVAATPGDSPAEPVPTRRSFGGQGRTLFMREIVAETTKRSSRRLRVVVWSTVAVLVAAVGGLLWWSDQRVRFTTAALVQQQETIRSESQADLARLRTELEEARQSSAPAAVLDSLREALDSASARTSALEASLERAQSEVTQQLAAAEQVRAAREAEVNRLNRQLQQAASSQVPRSLLDSLRQALAAAEHQVSSIDGQLRAVRGTDLASVAQDNQGAVGLVSAYIDGQMYSGSGFVVSAAGYFITNRHVIYQDGQADSVFVTMADHTTRERTRATVVRIPASSQPDLAILRVTGYDGPHIRNIDWSGTKARQGEPAALIGFPSGFQVALDRGTVRTSMSVGGFSMVTADRIQFDGFTIGGSSGSPIFNAAGEVVAVHRAGLRDQPGLAFAEPIHKAIDLLPAALRRELGLPAS